MSTSVRAARYFTSFRALAMKLVCKYAPAGRLGYNVCIFMRRQYISEAFMSLAIFAAAGLYVFGWGKGFWLGHLLQVAGVVGLAGWFVAGDHGAAFEKPARNWLRTMAQETKGKNMGWVLQQGETWGEDALIELIGLIPRTSFKRADKSILAGILVHPNKYVREAGIKQIGKYTGEKV